MGENVKEIAQYYNLHHEAEDHQERISKQKQNLYTDMNEYCNSVKFGSNKMKEQIVTSKYDSLLAASKIVIMDKIRDLGSIQPPSTDEEEEENDRSNSPNLETEENSETEEIKARLGHMNPLQEEEPNRYYSGRLNMTILNLLSEQRSTATQIRLNKYRANPTKIPKKKQKSNTDTQNQSSIIVRQNQSSIEEIVLD